MVLPATIQGGIQSLIPGCPAACSNTYVGVLRLQFEIAAIGIEPTLSTGSADELMLGFQPAGSIPAMKF